MNEECNLVVNNYTNFYFIGIGGIGMSSLARYFISKKHVVGGYDRVSSDITTNLQIEGASIHFEDTISSIPNVFLDKNKTLIIYTPAIPSNHKELTYFRNSSYKVIKRAELLGLITTSTKGLCVAGTHGKTTSSTLLAHLLNISSLKCNAFLGGISTNYGSNFLLNANSEYTVIEADEYDRSFLRLNPFASIITSVDPDHLDVYSEEESFFEGFQKYADLINSQGLCVLKHGINLNTKCPKFTYSVTSSKADYYAYNIESDDSDFFMTIVTPNKTEYRVKLGLPGIHNAENALACFALLSELKISSQLLIEGLKTFRGVKRRFEYIIKSKELVYIDDYAHHPSELMALIDSLKLLYPDKPISLIFQPHLFSRTRDFMNDFVEQLNRVDQLILMPIYPAREEPIEGVSSDILLSKVNVLDKYLFSKKQVLSFYSSVNKGVVVTSGAGDIDGVVSELKSILLNEKKEENA